MGALHSSPQSNVQAILSRYGQKTTFGCSCEVNARDYREAADLMTQFLTAGPADASAHILLAHGAGAAMTSPFLETMTRLLTERCLQVSRFEFDYMAARREGGKRRPPPRAELLVPGVQARGRGVAVSGSEPAEAAHRRQVARRSCRQSRRRRAVLGRPHRRAGMPRLSVPPPGQARKPSHGASRKARLPDPDRAGRA